MSEFSLVEGISLIMQAPPLALLQYLWHFVDNAGSPLALLHSHQYISALSTSMSR
ncbi:hypothetical protein ACPV5R_18595 [Vibrio astriarenae]